MAEDMKTYYGSPVKTDGVGGGTVTVRSSSGGPTTVLAHHYRHSIDGFNWGYGGSGPSDLSRSLILDAFGVTICPTPPPLMCECVNQWADPSYQSFKEDILAKFEQTGEFKLSQGIITDWVFDYLQGLPFPLEEPVGV